MIRVIFCCLILSQSIISCNAIYFSALDKFGIEREELLIKRVKVARDSQHQAEDQFKDLLGKFKTLVNTDGRNLEDKYSELRSALEKSENTSKDLKEKISSIRDIAISLFATWRAELNNCTDEAIRVDGQKDLDKSKMEYAAMVGSMRIASDKIEPALRPLRNNILYLRDNLSAETVRSLQGEVSKFEEKIEELLEELNRSTSDADTFIGKVEGKHLRLAF